MRDRPSSLLAILIGSTAFAPALALGGINSKWVSLVGLLSLGALSLNVWARRERRSGTGLLTLFPVIYLAVYIFGSASFPGVVPFFHLDIDFAQWLLYGLGLAAWLAGTVITTGLTHGRPLRTPRWRSSRDPRTLAPALAFAAGVVAILGFALNFATEGIPLLAQDINAARLGEHAGVIPKVFPLLVAFGQFSLVYFATSRLLTGRRLCGPACLVVAGVVVCFVLTASRAFLALPILAIVLLLFEYRLVSFRRLGVIVLAAVAVLVLGGSLRNATSGQANGDAATASQVPVVGPLLDAMQVGPHVFAAVRLRIPDAIPYQHGGWAARDAALILRTHQAPADLWIATEVLGRDARTTGGLPPTLVGGLYVDGGPVGVMLGMFLAGAFSVLLVRRAAGPARRPADALMVCFWGAYLLTSFYGYLSLKTNVIVVLGLGVLAARLDATDAPTRDYRVPSPVSRELPASAANAARVELVPPGVS